MNYSDIDCPKKISCTSSIDNEGHENSRRTMCFWRNAYLEYCVEFRPDIYLAVQEDVEKFIGKCAEDGDIDACIVFRGILEGRADTLNSLKYLINEYSSLPIKSHRECIKRFADSIRGRKWTPPTNEHIESVKRRRRTEISDILIEAHFDEVSGVSLADRIGQHRKMLSDMGMVY